MTVAILCMLILAAGVVTGWWAELKEWANGGPAQIHVKPENRGKARHSIAYQLDPVRAIDSVTILRPTPEHPHRWRLARTDGIAAVWSA